MIDRPEPTEHQIQGAFIQWTMMCRLPGIELGHANPNGGQRHIAVAAKLKKEGVKTGVPDWYLPIARGGFIGLAIEFKKPGENPTKEQRERMNAMQKERWLCIMCWNWEAAARMVEGYLSLMKMEPWNALR